MKTTKREPEREWFMLVVGVKHNRPPDERNILRASVMADVGLPIPDPPLTVAEMQDVAFAAKMALLKKLRERKKR